MPGGPWLKALSAALGGCCRLRLRGPRDSALALASARLWPSVYWLDPVQIAFSPKLTKPPLASIFPLASPSMLMLLATISPSTLPPAAITSLD